jgi:hypothetical protein
MLWALIQGWCDDVAAFAAAAQSLSNIMQKLLMVPYYEPTLVFVVVPRCSQALLEAFDATHVTSGMLWALIQGWCGDVAAALASHAADVEPSVQLAANAAAGRWPAVVSAALLL